MAEGVQGILEDMLPDLHDLVSNQVFTEPEVEAIVEKRREFEYKLARRTPLKRHFLKAIQYELELEELRFRRKSDQQITRPYSSDRTGTSHIVIRRVISLFQRLLRRFPGDISAWKEFIGFCLRAKASKALGSAVSKALQLHPRSEDFWLIAEGVERTAKGDLDASRLVLQKAVRLNSDSERLWIRYFRLEIEYLKTLREKGNLEKLSTELLDGEIPKLIFLEADKNLKHTSRTAFLKVCEEEQAPQVLRNFISEFIQNNA